MKWSYSKSKNWKCEWSLGFRQANTCKCKENNKGLTCYKCKFSKMSNFGLSQMQIRWMSNYDRCNCKCNVNVTHPAWYHNTGQLAISYYLSRIEFGLEFIYIYSWLKRACLDDLLLNQSNSLWSFILGRIFGLV